jgi:RNA 2',3'-cyclic 3'-phosphodiesterase
MHRLFIAYRPPTAIKAQLLAVMGDIAGARWQRDDQLHLTLRYIGAVDGRMAEEIAFAVESFTFAPISVHLSGVGFFDSRDQGQPLWAGVAPEASLMALHKKLDQSLIRLGLPPEQRRYTPHITLARFGRVRSDFSPWLAAYAGITSASFILDHICLMESRLGRDGGASYHDIVRSGGIWEQPA